MTLEAKELTLTIFFRLPHGRLLDYICARPTFDEGHAAEYIRQLLDVLHYLHNCRIAHLDIKVNKFVMIHPIEAAILNI